MAKTLSRLKNKKAKLLGQEVYAALKESIVTGELRPSQRLIEENLAAEMGASRTPVREAIQKLESEDLVIKLPKGGFIVRPLTAQDIEEVFGILSVLESYAAYLTTLHLTEKYSSASKRLLRNSTRPSGKRTRRNWPNSTWHTMM